MELGTVVSVGDSPNTYEYYFVISKGAIAKKGMYVYTENEQGLVLGYVSDLVRSNSYLSNPEVVSDYGGETLKQHFPIEKWDYLLGKVKIVGVLSKTSPKRERASLPPIPGNSVLKCDDVILKGFLGIDERGISLGKLFGHNLEVKVNLTRLFQKHLAILAMSGAGKSNLTKVIIEELLKRKRGKIASLIIDVHGEYSGLSKFSKDVVVFNARDFRIPFSSLNVDLFNEIYQLTSAQRSLYNSLWDPTITFDEFLNRISRAEKKSAEPLLRYLLELKSYNLIGEEENPRIEDLLKPGSCVVLNLLDISEFKKMQIIVFYLLKTLFFLRRISVREQKRIVPPTVVFIEEAHNFARSFDKSIGMAKRQIELIAREGRKFNFSLCLITQRPSHLSQTALSQCSSQIILRIANPNDQKFISEMSEYVDNTVLRELPSLGVGEGIVLGECLNAPVFVKFRRSSIGKTSVALSFEEEALAWEEEERKVIDTYLDSIDLEE